MAALMSIPLPTELAQFIAQHGLFEGFTRSESSGYVELWPVEDLPRLNEEIEIERYAQGFLAFAGNGGGEVLAFDQTGAVYMLPLIGMAPEYARRIADCFSEFAGTFEL